jgi:hypothetical protein
MALGGAVLVVVLAARVLLEPVPAYQLDLIGTAWKVEGIGDANMGEADLRMAFPDVDRFTVMTRCRELIGGFGYDTDGAGISFGVPTSTFPACSDSNGENEVRLVDALQTVESWRVVSDERIELRGDLVITLRRSAPHGSLERATSRAPALSRLSTGRAVEQGRERR